MRKIVDLCQRDPNRYKEYKKLKYKDTIYEINENIMISNADDSSNDFIGKLIRIMRIDAEKILTLIEIQWLLIYII